MWAAREISKKSPSIPLSSRHRLEYIKYVLKAVTEVLLIGSAGFCTRTFWGWEDVEGESHEKVLEWDFQSRSLERQRDSHLKMLRNSGVWLS